MSKRERERQPDNDGQWWTGPRRDQDCLALHASCHELKSAPRISVTRGRSLCGGRNHWIPISFVTEIAFFLPLLSICLFNWLKENRQSLVYRSSWDSVSDSSNSCTELWKVMSSPGSWPYDQMSTSHISRYPASTGRSPWNYKSKETLHPLNCVSQVFCYRAVRVTKTQTFRKGKPALGWLTVQAQATDRSLPSDSLI